MNKYPRRKYNKVNYPYQRYKKIRGERMLRDMFGDYDDNGQYIPWRYIVWSCKYGFAQSKFTKRDGKGIISFIDPEKFEKYVKVWICATKSQRKQIREALPDFHTIVKLLIRNAKLDYTNYLFKKYHYYRKYK